jgi:hypothetical protein
VRLVLEGGTQPGQFPWSTLRLKTEKPGLGAVQTMEGEGMPLFERSGHGDPFVKYNDYEMRGQLPAGVALFFAIQDSKAQKLVGVACDADKE